MTALRFVANPSANDGSRMYRSGDLARWRADGQLQFCGRADAQLKILGHRVEPSEIEHALLEHPDVRQAAIATEAGPDGTQLIVGYIVPADPRRIPPSAQLRAFLFLDRLPAPLVPKAVHPIAACPELPPASSTGEPSSAAGTGRPAGRPPAGPTEIMLADIWAELLGVDHVGVDENFFEAGGHSLLAGRVVSRVRAAFGVSLPLRAMFDRPTIAQLAEAVETLRWHTDQDVRADDGAFEEVELA